MFQFTRPQGARHGVTGELVPRIGFNSRARKERDYNMIYNEWFRDEFQFTRPQGARHVETRQPNVSTWVSIHAPARSATRRAYSILDYVTSFNSRARKERDSAILYMNAKTFVVSIHAPARSAT